MSSYGLPDITGVNPDFLQVNVPYFILRVGMKIEFENTPVFSNSIRMTLVDGTSELLVKGVDWVVNPEDIDEAGMSRAKLADRDFAGQLVKSITIFSGKAVNQAVVLRFQQFYQVNPNRTFDAGEPVEITPDYLKALATAVATVQQQVARVYSPVASSDYAPKLLPFDINKELPGNKVVDEEIQANTAIGVKILKLMQGAFFGDSLAITVDGVPLSKESDYIPYEVSPLTTRTTNKSGIYRYVSLVGEIIGTVKVSYHAVGGEVQPSDISGLYDFTLAVRNFLNDEVFITSESVVDTPAFRSLNARVRQVETKMRSLATGSPSYGDSTSGESVLRPITAVNSNFHWWTIASLYKTEGSDDIFLADQFKGRVHFPGANVSLAFSVDVNLNQPRNPVSFKTENLVFDPNYTLFGSVSVAAPVIPLLRVVWNESGQVFSGASLQIGIPLTMLSDKMVVEDMSTTESCWILDTTGKFVTGSTPNPSAPKDDGFTLPDGSSVWSATSSISKSRTYAPEFDKGYLVYSGSDVTLSQLQTNNSTTNKFNVVLPKYFPIRNGATLVVTLLSQDGTTAYDVDISLPRFADNSKKGKTDFVNALQEQVSITCDLHYSETDGITLALNAVRLSPPAANNPMSDVIRYVRVKV